MKNKIPLILVIIVVSIFIVPQVTFAAWWNPGTWKIFNRKSEIKTEQRTIATSTPNNRVIKTKTTSSKTESSSGVGIKKIDISNQTSDNDTEKPNILEKKQESMLPKTTGGGGAGATSGPRPVTPVNCSEYKNLFDSIPNCAIYSDPSSGVDYPLYKICKQCFPLDISQPLISNIQATNITENSATIIWDTNELADSKVFYATYSSSTNTYSSPLINIFDSAYKFNHSLNLNNLVSGAVYYYEVQAVRASGNAAIRTRQFFTTLDMNK